MIELPKDTEEGVVDKYVALSNLTQALDKEKTELANALIEIDEQYTELEQVVRDKNKTIANLLIENRRYKDLLKISGREMSELKDGYKVPVYEPQQTVFDKILRRKKQCE